MILIFHFKIKKFLNKLKYINKKNKKNNKYKNENFIYMINLDKKNDTIKKGRKSNEEL